MIAYDNRQASGAATLLRFGRVALTSLSCAMLVMSLNIAAGRGANAADAAASAPEAEALAPIVLAGRWTGGRDGDSARRRQDGAHDGDRGGCGSGPCKLTYDIVACGGDWCGITVGQGDACGTVAMKLTRSKQSGRENSFSGKLELAKGSDPYVIEAWYAAPDADAGDKQAPPRLSLVGDTGPELMMFRRSFPFSAELARSGDAKCTLEKATS